MPVMITAQRDSATTPTDIHGKGFEVGWHEAGGLIGT